MYRCPFPIGQYNTVIFKLNQETVLFLLENCDFIKVEDFTWGCDGK